MQSIILLRSNETFLIIGLLGGLLVTVIIVLLINNDHLKKEFRIQGEINRQLEKEIEDLKIAQRHPKGCWHVIKVVLFPLIGLAIDILAGSEGIGTGLGLALSFLSSFFE